MFLTRENDILLFKTLRSQRAKQAGKKFDRFCQRFSNPLCKKHQTPQYKDCRRRTADCGQWTTDSGRHLRKKTLLPI